jgi:hypothetical protein
MAKEHNMDTFMWGAETWRMAAEIAKRNNTFCVLDDCMYDAYFYYRNQEKQQDKTMLARVQGNYKEFKKYLLDTYLEYIVHYFLNNASNTRIKHFIQRLKGTKIGTPFNKYECKQHILAESNEAKCMFYVYLKSFLFQVYLRRINMGIFFDRFGEALGRSSNVKILFDFADCLKECYKDMETVRVNTNTSISSIRNNSQCNVIVIARVSRGSYHCNLNEYAILPSIQEPLNLIKHTREQGNLLWNQTSRTRNDIHKAIRMFKMRLAAVSRPTVRHENQIIEIEQDHLEVEFLQRVLLLIPDHIIKQIHLYIIIDEWGFELYKSKRGVISNLYVGADKKKQLKNYVTRIFVDYEYWNQKEYSNNIDYINEYTQCKSLFLSDASITRVPKSIKTIHVTEGFSIGTHVTGARIYYHIPVNNYSGINLRLFQQDYLFLISDYFKEVLFHLDQCKNTFSIKGIMERSDGIEELNNKYGILIISEYVFYEFFDFENEIFNVKGYNQQLKEQHMNTLKKLYMCALQGNECFLCFSTKSFIQPSYNQKEGFSMVFAKYDSQQFVPTALEPLKN